MGKNKKKEELVSWGVREEITLEKMKQFLSKQKNKKRPFSMTYVPACPHMPFDIQEARFEQFREGFGSLDGNYNGVYKNELLYMDWILTSLINHIKACGLLENTIIVMVSDHAEGVVSKKEGLGHGWSTAPNMANISLTIFPAEKSEQGTINPTIGSQVDLLPTILDYLEIPPPNHTLLQGVSIRKNVPKNRRIYLRSYADFSIVEGSFFYWLPKGNDSNPQTFLIENNEAQTFFTPTNPPSPEKIKQLYQDTKKFNRLQNSLILHFNNYPF